MAKDTPVNSQITDAVTQSNMAVLGNAPAQSMATAYQLLAQSVGVSMQNAVANQQNMNTIDSAILSQGISLLFNLDAAADASSVKDMLVDESNNEVLSTLQAIVSELKSSQAEDKDD
ncbi:R body protein [Sneathiella sp. P13V-1]|uniref:RebB family R body protein n=1 Tax=Sneathiella sp. P13V-1 TaxID=2697366 RepID=UPI00187BAB03|nr:RebB family R body protein [Sneathiella sp. P13V-1]MBE7637839.1 R body protein [Sneathiella sp. P13V-1]